MSPNGSLWSAVGLHLLLVEAGQPAACRPAAGLLEETPWQGTHKQINTS